MWLQRLLRELKVEVQDSVKMFSDSQAAISIAKNPVHHDRTKYIKIDRHLPQRRLTTGLFSLAMFPRNFKLLMFSPKHFQGSVLMN